MGEVDEKITHWVEHNGMMIQIKKGEHGSPV